VSVLIGIGRLLDADTAIALSVHLYLVSSGLIFCWYVVVEFHIHQWLHGRRGCYARSESSRWMWVHRVYQGKNDLLRPQCWLGLCLLLKTFPPRRSPADRNAYLRVQWQVPLWTGLRQSCRTARPQVSPLHISHGKRLRLGSQGDAEDQERFIRDGVCWRGWWQLNNIISRLKCTRSM